MHPGASAPECTCVYNFPQLSSAVRHGAGVWDVVKGLLVDSTVFFFSAQKWSSELSDLAAAAAQVLGVPSNANVFVSAPQMRRSFQLHNTHAYDAVVVQMEVPTLHWHVDQLCCVDRTAHRMPSIGAQGAQRWEVFGPTQPPAGVGAFGRGVFPDAVDVSSLDAPLINTYVAHGPSG